MGNYSVFPSEWKPTRQRIPQLDGVRGLAILLVIIWHYIVVLQPSNSSMAFSMLSLSWSGVDLFFVLSGFLIGGILLDNKTAENLYSVFYFRRALRILPLYFLLLLSFAVIFAISSLQIRDKLQWLISQPFPLWSYATFTQNFFVVKAQQFGANWLGVTWSLAIEEQFYLIMPLFLRIIPEKRQSSLIVICIVFALLIRFCFLGFIKGPSALYTSYVLLPSRADALMFGVLGAWIVRQPHIMQKLQKDPNLLGTPLLILGVGMLFLSFLNLPTGHILSLTVGFTWISAFYFVFILFSVTAKNKFVNSILCSRFLQGLGTVSYFVYLFHEVFLGIFHSLILEQKPRHNNMIDFGVTILALITTIALSIMSLRFIEKPLIQFSHRKKYTT